MTKDEKKELWRWIIISLVLLFLAVVGWCYEIAANWNLRID
jgi:hypothetical protein